MTTSPGIGRRLLDTGTRLLARLTSPDSIGARFINIKRTAAQLVVTPDDALKVSAVWACVWYLGRSIGQLPWRVYADLGPNQKRIVPTHPVDRLLHKRPNPEMTPMQFKRTMVAWAALHGNAIAEIEWDNRLSPLALWPLHPTRVSAVRDSVSGELLWQVTNEYGQPVAKLRPEDVFHLPGYGDGPIGVSVFEHAADSIGWARATEIFSGAMFGKGAHPSGIVKTKRKLSTEGLDALKMEFKQLYSGPDNAQEIMFLDSDMEWEALDKAPMSAQFIETRQHQVEEICRWFGVPPHKIQHLLRATFSNIEHQSIEVVVDSITPWAVAMEQEANSKLFSARGGYYTKLDLNALMRGDYKSRQEGLQIQRRNGVINADEWRALEDMNPIGGETGSTYIIEGNMSTIEKIAAPEPASQPTEQPNTAPQDGEGDATDEENSQAAVRAAALSRVGRAEQARLSLVPRHAA